MRWLLWATDSSAWTALESHETLNVLLQERRIIIKFK